MTFQIIFPKHNINNSNQLLTITMHGSRVYNFDRKKNLAKRLAKLKFETQYVFTNFVSESNFQELIAPAVDVSDVSW